LRTCIRDEEGGEKSPPSFLLSLFGAKESRIECPFQEFKEVSSYLAMGGIAMGRRCDICGKGTMFGHNVSHSNRRTKRNWKVNLKKVKVRQGDKVVTLRVCMSCLKKGNFIKVI